jgi:Uma2 family endonuclease
MGILKKEDLPEYTYEDYQRWKGDWELIKGIPYAMGPAPVKRHQMLVGYIFSELLAHPGDCPDCEVLIDEDWKLNSETVLKPDVSVVCGDDNPNYITKTPEIIFEVLSPSTAKRDEGLKFELYEEEGVKYYTLVYPDDLVAKVYKHNGERFRKIAECDTEIFNFEEVSCPFEFDFSGVFERFRVK